MKNLFKSEKELIVEGLPPNTLRLTVEAKTACAKIGIEIKDLMEKKPSEFSTSPTKKHEKDLVAIRH